MLLQHDTILGDHEFRRIRDMVYRHCGINLHDGKADLVRARMTKLLRAHGVASVAEYLERVADDATGREFGNMIDALCTNRTEFFREATHFDYLRETALPNLVRRKEERRRVRVWSAGCSTGQEPYSLTIQMFNALPMPHLWDLKVLGTDISRSVLRTAEAGVYAQHELEGVTTADRHKYFRPVPDQPRGSYEVAPILRSAVVFRQLNLMKDWPFGGTFDMIFCRNVMIYFDKPTQQRLVERFWERLESGGLLFTGHAESLTGLTHRFCYVRPAVYVRA